MSRAAFDDLRVRLAEIADLSKTASLLSWDQHVMMPARGASLRAEQLATVGRIAHTKFIDPEIGHLLEGLAAWGEQHDYDSFEASLIPAIDSLRSLGIVWIPGLMAGMLLSGSRPIYAAIYQFVVLAMIFAASGLTSLVSTLLIRSQAFTDAEQLRLRPGPASR